MHPLSRASCRYFAAPKHAPSVNISMKVWCGIGVLPGCAGVDGGVIDAREISLVDVKVFAVFVVISHLLYPP